MDAGLERLVWRGLLDSNPWWGGGKVPRLRTAEYRRASFTTIFDALKAAELGRGIVVLGPRRVGKTVLMHQVIEQLLGEGRSPTEICFIALDDVALRDRDLGELLALIEGRLPAAPNGRVLLLDEVQHAKDWSGWLKRIADRRDPYTFFATGSSATALRRGGQDAGLGRWREMTLYPWSFREHVELKKLKTWSLELHDRIGSGEDLGRLLNDIGYEPPPDETQRLESAFVDYLLRGGFPEVANAPDLQEARRRLRQDILDRALGRDVLDVVNVDARILERMFLHVCLNPGGLWNEAEMAGELGITRQTVSKYLNILEQAFLVFRLPNLANAVRGRPKVYLVAPALRQALLGLDEESVRDPHQWSVLAENTVAATAMSMREPGSIIGFWRSSVTECDVVVLRPGKPGDFIEVKWGGQKAERGIRSAAGDLDPKGRGLILSRHWRNEIMATESSGPPSALIRMALSLWLYAQRNDQLASAVP